VHHGELGLFAVKLDLENLVLKSVAALGSDVGDGAARARRESDQVVGDQAVLVDSTIGITTGDVVTDLSRRMVKVQVVSCLTRSADGHCSRASYLEVLRNKVPRDLLVQGNGGDTTRNIDTLRSVTDGL